MNHWLDHKSLSETRISNLLLRINTGSGDKTLLKSWPLLVEGILRKRNEVDKVSGLLYLPFKLYLRFDCPVCDPLILAWETESLLVKHLFWLQNAWKCKSMVLFFFFFGTSPRYKQDNTLQGVNNQELMVSPPRPHWFLIIGHLLKHDPSHVTHPYFTHGILTCCTI